VSEDFAGYLAAMVEHTRKHPDLSEVHLYGQPRWREVRVMPRQSTEGTAAAELAAWARSFGADYLDVRSCDDQWSSVEFDAEIDGQYVRVWAKVDNLPACTGLSVAYLEHFAAHGVFPERPGS
jgi:hypothetical protein